MNALCVLLVFLHNHQNPTVKLLDGPIQGTILKTLKGRDVFGFLGIPYAAPPIGDLRFEPPKRVVPWTKIRDASKYGNICKQPKSLGSEDCLNLNVYVPAMTNACNGMHGGMPVMIFFHSGGFVSGASSNYGPRYLLDKDIILVTANNRLGPLGFLSAGDELLPGNNGLKDQVAVLKWVKNNIARFGGDPSKVTISGVAAGATSVQLHFISKQSKDLFRGGISYSGTPLTPSAFQKDSKAKFLDFARRFDCNILNTETTLKCLRAANADHITNYQNSYKGFKGFPYSSFGPVLEKESKNAFITQYPYEAIRAGNIAEAPIIIQTVKNEGLSITASFMSDNALHDIDVNWNGAAPYFLSYSDVCPASVRKMIGDFIREHYFGKGPIDKHNFDKLTKLVSDRLFTNDIEQSARLFARACKSPVYLSRFSYRGHDSIIGVDKSYGVTHKDDIFYVFNMTSASAEQTKPDLLMIDVMTGIWANFTINGSPGVPKWVPLIKENSNGGELNYLEIQSPYSLVSVTAPNLGGEHGFWRNLPVNEPWGGRISTLNPLIGIHG